jgi:hypothetical protein
MKRCAVLLALMLAACATGRVHTTQAVSSGPLPPPTEVAVFDFAITPDQVKLERGVGPTLMQSGSTQSPADRQSQAAQATQAALAETLTTRLQAYGLRAVRELPGSVPPPGTLEVRGQILSVDQGNGTRRTMIGLGAGRSSIAADAQLLYVTNPAQPQFLQAFSGTADSGRMPGAVETMGAGAAADRLATSAAMTAGTHAVSEARRTSDEANADKLANALAKQIAAYAAQQGWLPAAAVQ